ncbi:MAG: FAD:protein FMN transferase [Candidatus Omnitrophica bacterium]|nr:FAD:protein FMN transferase [Candidatus Omnitrophota bacterium]
MSKKIISLFIVVIFVSCAKPLYKNEFVISGTYLRISSSDKRAAKIVYKEFRRLDRIFNIYNKQSELSRLNRTYNRPHKASDELIELLKLSQDLYNLSQGAFDVSHGALYKFWKELILDGSLRKLPTPEAIAKIREVGGMDAIEIDLEERTVTIKSQGLIIDLSGVAKGYIVDKAILRLEEEGIGSALINAGGDIYCLGMNKGVSWEVGVQDPNNSSDILGLQLLTDEAIATSGGYEQFFTFEGREYSHLIDPREGYPVDNNLISVSIISKNCTTSDGLATAFSILGFEGVNKFISNNPSTMRIFLVHSVDGNEQVHVFK